MIVCKGVTRYIVRFKGGGEPPAGVLERIRALPDADVVDASARMLLIEAPEIVAQRLQDALPEWSVTKEQTIPVPDPRPKLRRP